MAGLGSGLNYIPTNSGFQSSIGTNSTITPLSASASFNASGSGEQNQLPYVIVDCTSDVSGTLYFEFSVDGTNWSTYPTNGFSLSAGGRIFRSALKTSRYFRARFVNDSTTQTYFRLYTYYDINGALDTALNQSIGIDAGGVSTRPTNPQDEITRGLRGGVSQLNKFAFRTDVDTADGDALAIADNTTNTPTIMTSAGTFDIAYNNSTDGDSTTGALILQIQYLDSNFELQTTTHTLGSTGSDTTSFSGLGINRVVVVSSGSANVNTNDITITATTGSSVQAFIPAGLSVTQQLWFHLPINSNGVAKFLFLSALKISGGGSPRVTFKIFVYNRLVSTQYEVFRYTMDTSVENHMELTDPVNFPFSGRDVVWLTASTDTNNTEISARLSLNIYETV